MEYFTRYQKHQFLQSGARQYVRAIWRSQVSRVFVIIMDPNLQLSEVIFTMKVASPSLLKTWLRRLVSLSHGNFWKNMKAVG